MLLTNLYKSSSRQIRALASQQAFLIAAITVLLLPFAAQAEKRMVVAGIDKDGHLSYAWKGEEPIYDVKVTRPELPKTITIKNETGMKVRVRLYNGSDDTRLIAKRKATLDTGKSVNWPHQAFHLAVFEPALFDKHLATLLYINSDVVLRKRGNKVEILTIGVPVFSVTNRTSDTLHAKIYNEGDNIRLIPRKTLTVKPRETFHWTNAEVAKFRVRIHRQKLLGKVLSEARNVNVRSAIVVEELEWSPWKKLLQSEWSGGQLKETKTPKTIPVVGGLTADLKGYRGKDRIGDDEWRPQIFGMAPGNGIWFGVLGEERVYDAISGVHNSADWKLTTGSGDAATFAGQVASTPFVVGDGNSARLGEDKILFARSASGTLITKRKYTRSKYYQQLNTSGKWTDLGGNLDSHPAAVLYKPRNKGNCLMVFVRDAGTNALHTRSRDNSEKWSEWSNLGGSIQDAPFACSAYYGTEETTTRVDVFARGQDNALKHRTWLEGKGWKAWESLGGALASAPVAYAESDPYTWPKKTEVKTRFYVFALGTTGDMIYRYFNGSKWGDWKSLGGKFRSAPVVFPSDDES